MTNSTSPQLSPTPWWMTGAFRPVSEESTAFDLPISGKLPPDLCGRFLRIGPNPPAGNSPHWFLGAGMIHEVRIDEGEARSYRNRYVRGAYFDAVSSGKRPPLGDLQTSMANTHIVSHGRKLLALEETHLPVEIADDLSTVGPYDFGGKLTTGMTAHPKTCPRTGELLFFGYGFRPPFLTFHKVSADGKHLCSREIPVQKPTMMHDFHITEHYAIFMDLPLTIDTGEGNQTALPIRWDEAYGARLAVVPRDGDGTVQWFEIDPCSAGHAMNAFEDGSELVMDVCSKTHVFKPGARDGAPFLFRWRLNLETGRFSKERLSPDPAEFPRIADQRTGQPYRFGYVAVLEEECFDQFRSRTIRKFNMESGAQETFSFETGSLCGEPVFVPSRAGKEEDSGYLLVYVTSEVDDSSKLCVFDAQDLAAGPRAAILMPVRVPNGLHGSWINA